MTDPTGARLRDFDIPVIMPRIAFKELPVPDAGDPGGPGDPGDPGDPPVSTPVTTVTCAQTAAAAAAAPAAAPLVASAGVKPPVIKLGLPKASQRRGSVFAKTGLAFAVASDKAVSDVEVRLVQLLGNGKKRPLGAKLLIQPGHRTFTVVVQPTPYARAKLRLAGKTTVRAVAVVTALDGSMAQASADFTISR